MLSSLRRRIERREDEGFTLIELMVVILIIAILLAIAIPTFLGARSRAQDRAAQSSLRNALTSADTSYANTNDYSRANAGTSSTSVVGDLASIEPALTFCDTANTNCTGTKQYSGGPNEISVATAQAGGSTSSTPQEFTAVAKSKSGECFALTTIKLASSTASAPLNNAGTFYTQWASSAHNCDASAVPSTATWTTSWT
ncbi:MAG TPA: prepilin-type N-terminal cleavage/methylation domain-containing protein [Acidimicrobiales bacterium]|nr:prepilin-type N-terminal cleavage/methylation domain-containing protein [Acidimicrobiales bacterium]